MSIEEMARRVEEDMDRRMSGGSRLAGKMAMLVEADQADEKGQWEWAAWLRIYAWRGGVRWAEPGLTGGVNPARVKARRVPQSLHVWALSWEPKHGQWMWTSRIGWRRTDGVRVLQAGCPNWVRDAVDEAAALAVQEVTSIWQEQLSKGGPPPKA